MEYAGGPRKHTEEKVQLIGFANETECTSTSRTITQIASSLASKSNLSIYEEDVRTLVLLVLLCFDCSKNNEKNLMKPSSEKFSLPFEAH